MTWEELNKLCEQYGLKCTAPAPFAAIYVYRDALRDGRYFCLTGSLEFVFVSKEKLMELILGLTFC